ncbi:MAG TPA: hypothetical protein VHO69_00050, partial [Phototrophicaceae bacterium]|nr:hypothetical protein [Phototrophicaceae bacterium]
KFAEELEAQGVPLLDHVAGMPLDHSEDRVEVAKAIFDALPVGIGHLYLHPAQDTPELRALCSDWRCRVADYQAFLSPVLRDHIRNQGIQVIGYRALKDLMPVRSENLA